MTKVKMPEPVAVVASDYALFWAGSGPITPLVDRNGVKVGSQLITTDQAEDYAAAKVREALEEAALVCEERSGDVRYVHEREVYACADAIRALLHDYDALVEDNGDYVEAACELATENHRLRQALELAYGAMNYMGDILNNMDAVEEKDIAATGQAFEAVRVALAQEQS